MVDDLNKNTLSGNPAQSEQQDVKVNLDANPDRRIQVKAFDPSRIVSTESEPPSSDSGNGKRKN